MPRHNLLLQRTAAPPAERRRYASHMKLLAALTASICLLPIAVAETKSELSPAFANCIERAGAADPAVMECIGEEFTIQDRRLNASYRTLMAKLTPDRRKQLQDVQRAWLKYTEANCDFYHDRNGGTAARMMSAECSVRARATRARELEELGAWQ